MSEWLRAMGPGVANHLWQSTAFAAVAWVMTLALRKNHARVRYGVWVVASVKFLVPFSLLIGLGGMLPRPQSPVVAMPVYSAVDEVGMPFSAESMAVANPTHAAMTPRHAWGTRPMGFLPAVLAGIWGCGGVVVLVVWCGGWLQVKRTLRRAVRAESGREAEILRRVEAALGGRVGLLLSHELMEPGMFGIWRPVLIWPERLSERLDDEHIEAIVAHELMHARRRDNLTAALHMMVEAAFWFHPLVWWMERRMVEERERACDEAVVAMGSRPGVYAESLLKACRFCVESPLVCVAGITGADLAARVRAIMTLRAETLGWWRKVGLAILAVAAIAAPMAFGVVRMIPMYGQIPDAAGPLPAFEAATIKASDSERPGKGFTTDGRHFSTLNTTASDLLQYSYGIQARQIVDAPPWLDANKYDIAAVASGSDSDSDNAKWKLMVRKLLADRFGLTFHHDTKEMSVYELRIGKNGPKLTKSEAATDGSNLYFSRTSKSSAGMTLHARAATMAGLAKLLQSNLGRPVVDRTGLAGIFDFSVDFLADTAGSGDAASASGDMNAPPGIFTAIQEQIGLKLVSSKGPAEVIVIDHIEKPELDDAGAAAAPPVATAQMAAPAHADASQGNSPPPLPARPVPVAMVQEKPTVAGTSAKLPEFEVATVKPANPKNPVIGLFTYPGGRILCTNCPLQYLIMEAFGLQAWQVSGGPSWVYDARYDIEAKPPASSAASKLDNPIFKTPPTSEQREMLQSLLMDRFQLKIHYEPREGSVYILSRDDKPLKLQPPKDRDEFSWAGSVEGGGIGSAAGMAGTNISMTQLATRLSGFLKLPVVDETGLAGSYDFEYRTGYGDSNADATSAIFASIQGIGLKLKTGKGPVETIAIDRAERPAEN